MVAPQQRTIDQKNTDYDSSRFEGSGVNMMSPPVGIRYTRNKNQTPDSQLRLSVKNMKHGIYPKNNCSGQYDMDPHELASSDSEK